MDSFGQDVLHFCLLRTEPIIYLLSQMKESHGVDWTLPLDWPVSEVGMLRASVTCTITVGVARRTRSASNRGTD